MTASVTTGPSREFALIGDVGGTTARFALADLAQTPPKISNIRDYPSRAYAQSCDAIRAYLDDSKSFPFPGVAVIAVAGPIENGAVRFTNLGWTISQAELNELGIPHAMLLNDFEALALSTLRLEAGDLHALGNAGEGIADGTVAIIGPGTGFGASALVRGGGHAVAMATEGGHASFAPADETECEILRLLARKFPHVSIERILSGPGLQNLHEALDEIDGIADGTHEPDEITRRALAGEATFLRTLQRFCAILGSVAGDVALSYGARGGVFIAGGIAPAILPFLEKSEFRSRFEAKGRFGAYLRAIPTRVILHDHAAFLGAAERAHQFATET